jgi:hypothetical protein
MLYRVATFVMPETARPEFEERARQASAILRQQPGFIRDHWLEKISGAGAVDIITIVEWQDEESIRSADQVVRTMLASSDFDAAAFAQRHGIIVSRAVYAPRDTEAVQ